MDEESSDVFIDKLGNFDVIAKVCTMQNMPLDMPQLELDTTIDWFKYLDDESTGEYDFGDKCHKKRERNVKKLQMKKMTTLHLTSILKEMMLLILY